MGCNPWGATYGVQPIERNLCGQLMICCASSLGKLPAAGAQENPGAPAEGHDSGFCGATYANGIRCNLWGATYGVQPMRCKL